MEKENNTDKSDFSENEIINIEVINRSGSDEEEKGIEHKVKRIGNSEWFECSTEAVVGRCSSN